MGMNGLGGVDPGTMSVSPRLLRDSSRCTMPKSVEALHGGRQDLARGTSKAGRGAYCGASRSCRHLQLRVAGTNRKADIVDL